MSSGSKASKSMSSSYSRTSFSGMGSGFSRGLALCDLRSRCEEEDEAEDRWPERLEEDELPFREEPLDRGRRLDPDALVDPLDRLDWDRCS